MRIGDNRYGVEYISLTAEHSLEDVSRWIQEYLADI